MSGLLPSTGRDEYDGVVGQLLGALPRGHAWDLDVVSAETTLTIGADRRTSAMRVRKLVRARRDGIDRAILGYFGASDGEIEDADVRPGSNCGLGRVLRHHEGNVLAAEVLFGQRLRAGETWLFECAVHEATVTTDVAHNFRRPEGNHVLEIRFHPDALPANVHGYRTGLFGDPQRVSELLLNNHHSVHLAAEGMADGVIGISWRWEQRAPTGP